MIRGISCGGAAAGRTLFPYTFPCHRLTVGLSSATLCSVVVGIVVLF